MSDGPESGPPLAEVLAGLSPLSGLEEIDLPPAALEPFGLGMEPSQKEDG